MQLTTLLATFTTLASLTAAIPVEDLSTRQIVYNCYFNKSGVVSNYLVTVGSSAEVTVSGTTYELDCGTTSSPTVDPASPEDQSRWVYAKCQDGAVLPVWRSTTSVTCNL